MSPTPVHLVLLVLAALLAAVALSYYRKRKAAGYTGGAAPMNLMDHVEASV